MKDISKQVKELFGTASKQDLYFLERRPSLNQIEESLENYKTYKIVKPNFGDPKDIFGKKGYLYSKRVPMGEVYKSDEEIVGYNSFIIMNNASPTKYEKEFIDMGNNLNYFYMKKLFVHPDFRGQGIGTESVKKNLELAKELDKHLILDVEKNNYKMINILNQFDFEDDFNWTTPKGMKMIRFFHE